MGEESLGNGIFPPHPSSLHGFGRTTWFYHHPDQMKWANQANDPTAEIRTFGPLPFFEPLKEAAFVGFPCPHDLVFGSTGSTSKPLRLQKQIEWVGKQEADAYYLLPPDVKKALDPQTLYLNFFHFWEYLNGETNPLCKSIQDFTTASPKVGIGRDKSTRTTLEGHLYRVRYTRCQGKLGRVSFIASWKGGNAESWGGMVKFGAEGRTVTIRPFAWEDPYFDKVFEPPIIQRTIFKLYLATPAIFENGPFPNEIFKGKEVKLIARANGKAVPIGGWNIQERRPKRMMKAVPAGAVYYLEASTVANAQAFVDAVHNTCVSEERANEGFGWAFCANYVPQRGD